MKKVKFVAHCNFEVILDIPDYFIEVEIDNELEKLIDKHLQCYWEEIDEIVVICAYDEDE